MSDLYMRTVEKKKYLEENGYTYVEKWECELKKKKKLGEVCWIERIC